MTEKCEHCGLCIPTESPEPAGLSEEERAAWECLGESFGIERRALEATEEEWERDHCAIRTRFMAFWKAARAPLEAELEKLRERVRELEKERDTWKESARRWAANFHEAEKHVDELRAQLAQAQKPAVSPSGKPAAPPPGEVSTENLDRWSRDEGHSTMRAALLADIRAAVERATAKAEARIAELEEVVAFLDKQVTEWASRYSERCKANSKVLSQAAEFRKERDAALAEVERLKDERFPSAKKANLEALCSYLNDTQDQEPEHYAGCDVAWLALVALKRARGEVERLKVELRVKTVEGATAVLTSNGWEAGVKMTQLFPSKAPKRCPADGMSDEEIWYAINDATMNAQKGQAVVAGARKARELFTPSEEAK